MQHWMDCFVQQMYPVYACVRPAPMPQQRIVMPSCFTGAVRTAASLLAALLLLDSADSPCMRSTGELVQNWNDPPLHADLTDLASGCNWVAYNGGVGPEQLRWLRQELQIAQDVQQRVVVFGHCPIHPGSVNNRLNTLLWNYAEVLDVLAAFPQVVAATFTGALSSPTSSCESCSRTILIVQEPRQLTTDCITWAAQGLC